MVDKASRMTWKNLDYSQPMSEQPTYRASLMTPAQHRRMAVALRRDLPDDPEALACATAHEQIAAALERREGSAVVTPAMIEAGAEVLRECGAECFAGEYRATLSKGELAELVYRAMASVAPAAGQQNGERPSAKT